jgi:outer membrane protein OmpA-like peptidoglycan-associated protein
VPLDPGHDETAWAKNRRVHFSAYSDRAGKN